MKNHRFWNRIVIFVQPSSCRKSRKKTALLLQPYLPKSNMAPENRPSQKENSWKAKCPIFKAIVAGFRGIVASKNRTLGVPGYYFHSEFLCFFCFCLIHYLEWTFHGIHTDDGVLSKFTDMFLSTSGGREPSPLDLQVENIPTWKASCYSFPSTWQP